MNEKAHTPDWIFFDLNKILMSAMFKERKIRVQTDRNSTFTIVKKDAPHAWMNKEMIDKARSALNGLRPVYGEDNVKQALRRMKAHNLDGWMPYVAAAVLLLSKLEKERLETLVTHLNQFFDL